MRTLFATTAAAMTLSLAAPAFAQSVEELQAELEAQKQLNDLLKQRIESLEAQLEGRAIAPPVRSAELPEDGADPQGFDRALERALTRRGAAVLPGGVVEVTPSLSWAYSGSDSLNSSDSILGAALDARAGLQGGWMVGATVPFVRRDVDGLGEESGLGDISVSLWKSLLDGSQGQPALVARLRYTAPTGKDLGDQAVPLGGGFHRLGGSLTAVKTMDPVAFYGTVSYDTPIGSDIDGLDLDRSGIFGAGAGVSLAVSPTVSASAGLDFGWEDAPTLGGVPIGGNRTYGQVELGVGVVLKRNLFLNVGGAVGVTDDSPDIVVGISLPYRF